MTSMRERRRARRCCCTLSSSSRQLLLDRRVARRDRVPVSRRRLTNAFRSATGSGGAAGCGRRRGGRRGHRRPSERARAARDADERRVPEAVAERHERAQHRLEVGRRRPAPRDRAGGRRSADAAARTRAASRSRICRRASAGGKCHERLLGGAATATAVALSTARRRGGGARRADAREAAQRFADGLFVAAVELRRERRLVAGAGESEHADERARVRPRPRWRAPPRAPARRAAA